MRAAVVSLFVIGCGEPHFVAKPLPELVVETPPSKTAIQASALLLVPGEHFLWEVKWKGLSIARAELAVGDAEVKSRFATGGLAGNFAHVEHELVTIVDRDGARPASVTDHLIDGSEVTDANATFDGSRIAIGPRILTVQGGKVGHTIHTALGSIRAWAQPGARPGFLDVLHAGELLRIEFDSPTVEWFRESRALRVNARVRSEPPITIVMWIGADERRIPYRFEIARDGDKLAVEKLDE